MWRENTSDSWLFWECYKAVSFESCLIMLNKCKINCRHHLMFLFLQVFPFPDVLECCLVLLHLGSLCPPELQEEALALLRKHGDAAVHKKAARSFLTWHLETKLSPGSCLQLLNTKAALSSSEGFFWWLWLLLIWNVRFIHIHLYSSTDTYVRRLLENWKAVECGLELL